MVVISKKAINEFSERYPNSLEALLDWYKKTKEADWNSFNELKQTFNSADTVGNGLYVFNIKGSHYRLITRIIFGARTVFIRYINTHTEYNKVNLSDL